MKRGIIVKPNDRMFYLDKEIKICKTIDVFNLAYIQYNNSPTVYIVDMNTLSYTPQKESSISLKLLCGASK